MSITIKINGLPVEFTDQKPDKPCACWRIKQVGNATYGLELAWVECGRKTGRLIDKGSNKTPYIDDLYKAGWRFSPPLVPVTEVEKAWFEGRNSLDPLCDLVRGMWKESNARKVVNGWPRKGRTTVSGLGDPSPPGPRRIPRSHR